MSRDYSLIDPDRGFGATVAALSERLAEVERLLTTLGPGITRTFSPSLRSNGNTANFTGVVAEFNYDGQWIDYSLKWQISGALTTGGVVQFDLPVPVLDLNLGAGGRSDLVVGHGFILDATINRWPVAVMPYDDPTVCAMNYGFTNSGQQFVSATLPVTWGANDSGMVQGRYRWR